MILNLQSEREIIMKKTIEQPTTNSTIISSDLYEVIFPLLRSALWGNDVFPFTCEESVDWNAINKELQLQAIRVLPVDVIACHDKAHSSILLQSTTRSMRKWYTLMQEQQKLYLLFKDANIPFVILKGAAANIYYPKPSYRQMGDIDLIVKPEDFDKATKLMSEHNYEQLNEEDYRHQEYRKNGVSFELHRSFAILKEDEPATWLDTQIFNGISNVQDAQIDGFHFPMLPTMENGLVLLTHINQHLESGLGLRQIIDWMLFVNKELDDAYWYSTFEDATDKIGLKTLAITVTKMCQKYLGLTQTITWAQQADDTLCDTLMEYIITQGNFGRKFDEGSNNAIKAMSVKNLALLCSYIQHTGITNWKAIEKYPFLKPFAWIYQIFHYIHIIFQRKHPFKQLREEYTQSNIRNNMFEQLQVARHAKETINQNTKS